jgi:hypothetical protein
VAGENRVDDIAFTVNGGIGRCWQRADEPPECQQGEAKRNPRENFERLVGYSAIP